MRMALAWLLLAVLWLGPAPAAAAPLIETPALAAQVAAGLLAPVAQRLPRHPRVLDLTVRGKQPGRHGGTLRMLIAGQKDIRLMTYYSYARLVGYDQELELKPDILENVDVEDGRIFTLTLREGHRWSDGHPFTAEDFRYAWEDVILNRDLSPGAPPGELVSHGKLPRFEVIDARTVRYTWADPNPDFLPALAATNPVYLMMPAHYLKQYHRKYQSPERLAGLVELYKAKNWVQMHTRLSRQSRPENPDLPTLDPWRNVTHPPAEQFIFERNPYFHRIDGSGRQLPYIDRVEMNISSASLIPAKAGAGESDLQGRYIEFDDYTFLKEAEKHQPIAVKLWERGQGAKVAILPNLNYEDPDWRAIMRDARFRRALSLAIDRTEINKAVFFGLASESADTLIPQSPLYRKEYAQAWAERDVDKANRLLDEMGLGKRNGEGYRLLPDGRLAEVIVETAGESTGETDVLELVTDHWRDIGIRLLTRATQRDIFRSRIIGGMTMMAVWSGIDNAIATPDMNPRELAPTSEAQLQWPLWGMHYETRGQRGSPPDLPQARALMDLLEDWHNSRDRKKRARIWRAMLDIYTDQVFSIGIVNRALQPVVVAKSLRNVPDRALFSFAPTAYFGVYMPDTFWFEAQQQSDGEER